MLKLSFTTMATPDLSGVEAIKMARRFGFQGVDLRVSPKKGELTVESTTKEINELRDVFASEGIEKSGLLCYNNAITEEASSLNGMKESVLKNLDVAAQLGSPSIRIFTGDINCLGDTEEHIKRTVEAISDALNEDQSGINIYVQNHYMYYPAMDSIKLINLVRNPRFKLVFSPEHLLHGKNDINEVYPLIKEVTGQFYVNDVKKEDDKYVDVLPGSGVVPIEHTYRALGGRDFEGWVTFKWEKLWQPELEDAEIALPAFIEYFNKLYASL
jgi:sugar phosphate isomerase/epimerase